MQTVKPISTRESATPPIAASLASGEMRQRVLFVTSSHYLPELTGGVESTTHEISLSLGARQWATAVLARTRRMSRFAWKARANRLMGRGAISCDSDLGYPTYRSRKPLDDIGAVCTRFSPTLAVVQSGETAVVGRRLVPLGIPTLVFLHQLTNLSAGHFIKHPLVRYVTVSQFMASKLETMLGQKPDVISPLVASERYITNTSREMVTFVNPTGLKGVDIALHLARTRPDLPFMFVEGWPQRRRERQALKAALSQLPNVRFVHRSDDMRPVYARTRILLMPSQCLESWGRVATEAQLNGIPVIASHVGGLPESVGPGGILVSPHDDPAAWEQALSQMWDDEQIYKHFSQAAIEYSRRPDIQPEALTQAFVRIAESHVRQAGRA